MGRPCSSQVYQVTPTPESCATSSRRRPGVRRRKPGGIPTSAGVTRARRPRRKPASSGLRRCVVFIGFTSPVFHRPRRTRPLPGAVSTSIGGLSAPVSGRRQARSHDDDNPRGPRSRSGFKSCGQ